MEPLVSVIIPVYNKEEYVRACVDSVLAQTYKNLEIILVNDGSKDNSLAVCKDIAKENPRVVLIDRENGGVSVARNTGMEKATGEYITFLDADDTLRIEAVKALVEAAQMQNSHMTIGRASEKDDLGVSVLEGEEYLIKSLEDNPMTYSVWRILYRRDFVQDLKFPQGYVCHEDSFFTFLCGLKMPRVATIDTVIYNYNYVGDSVSRSSFTAKKYGDICSLLAKKEEIIRGEHSHLLPLFNHLKVKIQMMLLTSLSVTKGKEFRVMEKETLARFNEVKEYYKGDLPCANPSYFRILDKNLYHPHRLYMNIRRTFLRLIKK